jgi:hypothetical protein
MADKADLMMEAIKNVLRDKFAQIDTRLDELGALIANTKSMQYRGIFAAGTPYDEGDTVTHGGSLWHCNQLTKDRPGEGAAAWTLAVKRGRDGRDAIR